MAESKYQDAVETFQVVIDWDREEAGGTEREAHVHRMRVSAVNNQVMGLSIACVMGDIALGGYPVIIRFLVGTRSLTYLFAKAICHLYGGSMRKAIVALEQFLQRYPFQTFCCSFLWTNVRFLTALKCWGMRNTVTPLATWTAHCSSTSARCMIWRVINRLPRRRRFRASCARTLLLGLT